MADRKSDRTNTDRKSGGFRTLGTSLNKMTRPIFGKRGLADGAIALEWPQIVGASLAKVTLPERISYPKRDRRDGTLYLKVAGGSFATELIHFEPQLIERINRYFGYQAVSKVRILQGPITHPATHQNATPEHSDPDTQSGGPNPAPNTPSDFAADLSHVSDPALLEALKSLGQAVHNRRKTVPNPDAGRHKTATKT